MISLEHIRQLQDKVNKAVDHLGNLQTEKDLLQEENDLLRSKISSYETRIAELESFIEEFKSEQSEIEMGIISALKHLDTLEEAVDELKTEPVARIPEADHSILTAKTPEPAPEAPAPAEQELASEDEVEATAVDSNWSQSSETIQPRSDETAVQGETVEDEDSGQLDIF